MPLAKQLDPGLSRSDIGLQDSGSIFGSDPGFNEWLDNLPADDWTGAINESALTNVVWVDGVGFVQRDT